MAQEMWKYRHPQAQFSTVDFLNEFPNLWDSAETSCRPEIREYLSRVLPYFQKQMKGIKADVSIQYGLVMDKFYSSFTVNPPEKFSSPSELDFGSGSGGGIGCAGEE